MMQATPRPSYAIEMVTVNDQGLVCKSQQLTLRLTVFSATILEIAFTPLSTMDEPRSSSQKVNWEWWENDKEIVLRTPSLLAKIARCDGKVQIFDCDGNLLYTEASRLSHTAEIYGAYRTLDEPETPLEYVVTPDGKKPVVSAPKRVFDKKMARLKLKFAAEKSQGFYGLGQFPDGTYNLRNKMLFLHQANMQIVIPMLISTGGYGIFFDMECPMIFDDTKEDTMVYAEAAQQFSYYIIAGTPKQVIRGYRKLTGKAALLPQWAYGYLQSKEKYDTQQELLEIIQEYRKRNLPIDCVILDWESWPAGLWGQKTLDFVRFPNPEKLTAELADLHAHWMVSIWPNMAKGGSNHEEMKAKQCLLPNSENYDAYSEKARTLYWKQLKEGLYDYGVHAFWCDCTEPISPEWSHGMEPPAAMMYADYIRQAENFLPMDKANSYGLYHAQGIYENMRSMGNERVCNLTRSGYSGQQKYGAILWSGDTAARWDILKNQIAAGISFAAAGMPWWTLDIGGFFAKCGIQWFWDGAFANPQTNKGFWELYLRWFAYGAFLPVFRSHGTDVCREIWHFGSEGTTFYDALCKWLKLRYRLMPTIYSWAAACHFEDGNMMQGLALCYPEDKNCRDIADEYLFGDSILVCPVTEPMYFDYEGNALKDTAKCRSVYLPEGYWYEFLTGAQIEGGTWILASAKLDEQPMYVREGSILVMGEDIAYAGQKSQCYTIRIYPGKDAGFVWYEDDGISYDYENGTYAAVKLLWNDKAQMLSIHKMHGDFFSRNLCIRIGEKEISCKLEDICGKSIHIQ